MKFFAGFMTGIVVTLLGVLFFLKREAPAPAVANSPSEQTLSSDSPNDMPAGFAQFFEQFHTDSLYQIAHITFLWRVFPQWQIVPY